MNLHKMTLEKLMSFPSYVHSLEDVKKLSKMKLKRKIDETLPDIVTHDSDMEIVRDYNLLAFFYFLLGQEEKAFEFIGKTLSKAPENINGLVLKSWFYLKCNDLYQSKEVQARVTPLKENAREMIFASAELAYIYTRLGIQLYSIGENKYELLFKEIKEKKIDIEPKIYTNWKFGQGLIMKRLLNVNNLYEENTFDITFERLKLIFRHFKAILSLKNIDKKQRARTLIEMGELTKYDISKHFPDTELFEFLQDFYFQEALVFGDSDPIVLERCGRYFRYRNIDKSIELLEESLSLCKSSYSHHHLALSIKRKLLLDQRLKSSFQPYWNVSRTRRTNRLQGSSQRTQQNVGSSTPRENVFRPIPESWSSIASADSVLKGLEQPLNHTSGLNTLPHTVKRNGSRGALHSSTEDCVQTGHFEKCSSIVSGFDNIVISDSYTPRNYRGYSRRNVHSRRVVRSNSRDFGIRGKQSRSNSDDSKQGSGGINYWIKSPKTVEYILEENANTAEEILFHLSEAYVINENTGALYDKGLMLRALRRYDEAIEIFKQLMGNVNSSLVYLATAYEQSALCLQEKNGTIT